MGFLDFDRPGPGISPDAPKKKGIFLYFELLMRNIGSIIKTNVLYFLVSLPMIAVSIFAALYFVSWFSGIFSIQDPMLKSQATVLAAFVFVVFIGSGPASAALSFFFRSTIREEHVYLISGFFKSFKKNFRQAIMVGIIQPLVTFLLLFCMVFYGLQYITTGSIIWFLFMLIVGVFCLVFTMAGLYIYQLMITFENSLLEIYKNAFILALIKAPQNIGIMLIITLLSYLVFFALTPLTSLILAFIGAISVMRFATELYSARVIDKNILQKSKED